MSLDEGPVKHGPERPMLFSRWSPQGLLWWRMTTWPHFICKDFRCSWCCQVLQFQTVDLGSGLFIDYLFATPNRINHLCQYSWTDPPLPKYKRCTTPRGHSDECGSIMQKKWRYEGIQTEWNVAVGASIVGQVWRPIFSVAFCQIDLRFVFFDFPCPRGSIFFVLKLANSEQICMAPTIHLLMLLNDKNLTVMNPFLQKLKLQIQEFFTKK